MYIRIQHELRGIELVRIIISQLLAVVFFKRLVCNFNFKKKLHDVKYILFHCDAISYITTKLLETS